MEFNEVQNAKFVSMSSLENMINNKEIVPSVGERYYYVKDKLNRYMEVT